MKLSRPSLAGCLAILNCTAWVLLFVIGRSFNSPVVLFLTIPLAVLLSVPFAWILILQWSLGLGPVVDVVAYCTVIGINSLVWGHEVAALLKPLLKYNSKEPLDVTPVDRPAPRIVAAPDNDNPYAPPNGE